MSKYIDAEKLKAEIQKRSMHAYEAITADEPQYRTHYKLGRYEGLRDLIDFIDSLQQEPVKKKTFDDYLKASPAERRKMNMTEILGAEKLAKTKEMMEQPTNTDNLCSEIANFLIGNDIQEDKAKFLANRIADLYGSKKYLEGLCDGIKQEQPETSNNLVDVDAVREDFIMEVYRVLDADPTNDRANAIIDTFDSLPTVSQERPEVDLEEEIQEYIQHLGFGYGGWVDGLSDEDLKNIARHFYELGQQEMRHRITNPEYNAKVVEQFKSEYPTTKEE